MTGLLQQSLVDDDAVGLEAVANGLQLAGLIIEVELIGGQLVCDSGVSQIQGVLVPVVQAGQVADVEDGGSLSLGHLGGQGVGVGAGSGGDDLDGNAGGLGVQSGQLLHGGVGLGLEVQVVNTALSGGVIGSSLGGSSGGSGSGGSLGLCGGSVAAASSQTQHHDQSQQHSNQLFHLFSSYSIVNRKIRCLILETFHRFHVLSLQQLSQEIKPFLTQEMIFRFFHNPRHPILGTSLKRFQFCRVFRRSAPAQGQMRMSMGASAH